MKTSNRFAWTSSIALVALAGAACAMPSTPGDEPVGVVDSALWGGWETLGYKVDPTWTGHWNGTAVASWGPGRLDWFYAGAGNTLRHRFYNGGWSGEEILGRQIASTPAAVSWGPGRIDVVYYDYPGGALKHVFYDGAWHTDWITTLKQPRTGATPGLTTSGPGTLDLFYVAVDGSLRHLPYSGGWRREEVLTGTLSAGVTAIATVPGEFDLFTRGPSDDLRHMAFTTAADAAHPWWKAGYWTGWESLGGAMRSDPAVSSWGPGRLDVFYIGTDAQLKHRFRWDGGSAWAPGEDTIGGLALDTTPPGAVSWGPGRIDIFANDLGPGGTAHTWWQ
jgi:hypothetical protein